MTASGSECRLWWPKLLVESWSILVHSLADAHPATNKKAIGLKPGNHRISAEFAWSKPSWRLSVSRYERRGQRCFMIRLAGECTELGLATRWF